MADVGSSSSSRLVISRSIIPFGSPRSNETRAQIFAGPPRYSLSRQGHSSWLAFRPRRYERWIIRLVRSASRSAFIFLRHCWLVFFCFIASHGYLEDELLSTYAWWYLYFKWIWSNAIFGNWMIWLKRKVDFLKIQVTANFIQLNGALLYENISEKCKVNLASKVNQKECTGLPSILNDGSRKVILENGWISMATKNYTHFIKPSRLNTQQLKS